MMMMLLMMRMMIMVMVLIMAAIARGKLTLAARQFPPPAMQQR